MQIKQVNLISVQDWDTLVSTTYNRPYSLQQQDDCKPRGIEFLTVPPEEPFDYENDTIPEEINGDEMGVSFSAWLKRDPQQPIPCADPTDYFYTELFWERNFYPSKEMIAQDLFNRGLLPQGEYVINIDW